jgi:Glycosyltransferase family 92
MVVNKMKYIILFCYFLLFSARALTFQFELSMCCIFQNEDRFLKEWIDYHRLVGVEHFYMYDNLSTDQFREVLDPYINAGIVEYFVWDKNYDTPAEWWNVQRNAYIDAIKRSIGISKWLCIIDTDEFIVPIKDKNIPDFLKDYESYGGVFINWVLYGTSGIQRIPKDKWMVSCLLNRAELTHYAHNLVKSIVRPERVDLQKSSFPHTCSYISPYFHVNPDKKKPIKGKPKDVCINRIRINHYWSRDLEYLMEHKFPRNARWYGEKRALEKVNAEAKMNEIFDPIILEVINRFPQMKISD